MLAEVSVSTSLVAVAEGSVVTVDVPDPVVLGIVPVGADVVDVEDDVVVGNVELVAVEVDVEGSGRDAESSSEHPTATNILALANQHTAPCVC